MSLDRSKFEAPLRLLKISLPKRQKLAPSDCSAPSTVHLVFYELRLLSLAQQIQQLCCPSILGSLSIPLDLHGAVGPSR